MYGYRSSDPVSFHIETIIFQTPLTGCIFRCYITAIRIAVGKEHGGQSVPCLTQSAIFQDRKMQTEVVTGMNLREMEYFAAIAKEKNLTHAAEKLYVSQPTLTKVVQSLEKELGLTLFTHIGKKLQLTFAGERLLDYVQRILLIRSEMDMELSDIRRSNTGRLRVGMPPFRCSFVMPYVLPRFHAMHPNIDLVFMEADSATLDDALLSGDLEVAFYNLSEKNSSLEYDILEADEVFAILPKGHPLRKSAAVDGDGYPVIHLGDLAGEIFILQSRSQRLGQYLLRELEIQGLHPARITESSNIRAAALLAANGYGVSFMSGGLLRHFEYRDICEAYRLADCHYSMNFTAAMRKDSYLPEYARDLIRLVREMP